MVQFAYIHSVIFSVLSVDMLFHFTKRMNAVAEKRHESSRIEQKIKLRNVDLRIDSKCANESINVLSTHLEHDKKTSQTSWLLPKNDGSNAVFVRIRE